MVYCSIHYCSIRFLVLLPPAMKTARYLPAISFRLDLAKINNADIILSGTSTCKASVSVQAQTPTSCLLSIPSSARNAKHVRSKNDKKEIMLRTRHSRNASQTNSTIPSRFLMAEPSSFFHLQSSCLRT